MVQVSVHSKTYGKRQKQKNFQITVRSIRIDISYFETNLKLHKKNH